MSSPIRSMLLTVAIAAAAPGASAQGAPAASVDDRTVWQSPELHVTFAYGARWKPVPSTQPQTRITVNWRTKQSQTLLATCYLEATEPNGSNVAKLGAAGVERRAEAIAQSYVENMRKRAPDAKLITSRLVRQDGHPAVYMEREGSMSNFDRTTTLRLYSIVTSWDNREINLECGSPLTTTEARARPDEQVKRLVTEVETAVKDVLRTLQFHR